MNAASNHLSMDTLLDYWLHDADAATADAVDEHLIACEACGESLDELIALGEGVRSAFRAGMVSGVTTGSFVRGVAAQGLKVREYRLPHNGSVNCSVAPDDQLLVAHLEVPLHGIERLDAVMQLSTEPGLVHKLPDIPFDAQSGEVLYVPPLSQVRALPTHTMQLTLLAQESGRTREVARYTFHHRPWQPEDR